VKFVLFYHSALSDWNHGNAHFLRGIVTELDARGHEVVVCEPVDAWSAANLVADHGRSALQATRDVYPALDVIRYGDSADLDVLLADADVVIVHEWTSHDIVRRIGAHRATGRYTLLFHDTHHRSVSDTGAMALYDLEPYDGVLAFGEVIRERYIANGWTHRAWTWHEAADTRVFRPHPEIERHGDLVWIGNWGDDERTSELSEFLIEPVRALRLSAMVHGVRYPADAVATLREAGIHYGGWLANYRAPEVFARHRVTVHVPRRPYVTTLPGIPTIRIFEALACGIPLVSARWDDVERLFSPGEDYLVARDGAEMRRHLMEVLHDRALADALGSRGRRTIEARHTCAHRVDELLAIVAACRGRECSVPPTDPARGVATL
jgi:spore maturation protein CgeB